MGKPIALKKAEVPRYVESLREAKGYNDKGREMVMDMPSHFKNAEIKAGFQAVADSWGPSLKSISEILGRLGPYAAQASGLLFAADDDGKELVLQARES